MVDSRDAFGIYDRLSVLYLRMQEMTQLCLMVKEGILKTEATADMSSSCLGSLYTLFDIMTERLDGIVKDFDKIFDKNDREDCNNGV